MAMIFWPNGLLCVGSDMRTEPCLILCKGTWVTWVKIPEANMGLWALGGIAGGVGVFYGGTVISPAIDTWTKDHQYQSPQAHKWRVYGDLKKKKTKTNFLLLLLDVWAFKKTLENEQGRQRHCRWMQSGVFYTKWLHSRRYSFQLS